jgi:hypothetical protein
VDIWRIEVQHPPSKLVDYIASTGGWHARAWAVERAVELGVPKEKVRDAVIAHANKITPVGKNGVRPGLFDIKRVALRLGVLQEDDLPDVKLRDKGPPP